MKKILLLIAAICSTVGSWAEAGIFTTLPEMSTDGNIKWYKIKNLRCDKYATYAGANAKMTLQSTATNASYFYFTGSTDANIATVKIHNFVSTFLCAENNSWTENGITWYIGAQPQNYTNNTETFKGLWISKNNSGNSQSWNNENGQGNYIAYYNGDDVGSSWKIEAATDDEIQTLVEAYKTSQATLLDSWAKLAIFDADLISTAKTNISNYAADALAPGKINADIKAVTDNVATKYITFMNAEANTTSVRYQAYLYAKMTDNRAYGGKPFTHNAVWMLQSDGEDGFYLYNALNNRYLGTPGENGSLKEGKNNAAVYQLEVKDTDNVRLMCGAALHLNNHTSTYSGYYLMGWDNDSGNDNASRWIIKNYDIVPEIETFLEENSENHESTPSLGKYSTSKYEAISTALDAYQNNTALSCFVDLCNAVSEFNSSLNRPVYIITSAWDDGYPKGSSIYYDGSGWKWATKDIFNKKMWMVIKGHYEEDFPTVDTYNAQGTHYEICDYLTETVMRNKKVQIVSIEGWEGVYNLQYGTATNDAVQHAQNTGNLVNWNPATTTVDKASAWRLEYVGNSYDLDKLTDEKLAALNAVKTAYLAKAYAKNAVLGTGLGQYDYTNEEKAVWVTALEKAEPLDKKTLTELANIDVEEINSIAEDINDIGTLTINQPETGKFYRIKGGANESLANYYITGNTNSDGGRIALKAEADAATIYYYADGKLMAYDSGKYIGLSSSRYVFANGSADASAMLFAGSTRTAGTYTIKSADCYLHYKVVNSAVELDRCSNDVCAQHDWILEEVTSLPLTIHTSGKSTFAAPVALTIPEDVTVYYAKSVNGDEVTMSTVEGAIAANTGVVVEGTAGATVNFTLASEAVDALENNLLKPVVEAKAVTATAGHSVYVLATKTEGEGESAVLTTGFYALSTENNAIGGHKSYLEIETENVSAARLKIIWDENATGIKTIESAEKENAGAIYNLAGQKLVKAQKGVNIINGKIVIK